MSAILMCAGVGSRLGMLPVSLAGVGLIAGIVAAVQRLPSDATEDVLVAMFMNFPIVALWVLVIAVF